MKAPVSAVKDILYFTIDINFEIHMYCSFQKKSFCQPIFIMVNNNVPLYKRPVYDKIIISCECQIRIKMTDLGVYKTLID